MVTVNRISDINSGHDLIAASRDSRTNNRGDIPSITWVTKLDNKNHNTTDS